MRHLTFLPSILLAAGTAAHAAPDLHLRELSRCDRSFFEKLAESPAETQALAPMRRLGASAAFSVPDARHPTLSKVLFTKSVDIAGTTVVGYFDEVQDMPRGMSSYAWGYLIAGSVGDVALKLRGLVWDPMRLRKDGEVFVRSEIWFHDQAGTGWVRQRTEVGVPSRGTVERVLLIEPYAGEIAYIRFGCAIQGNITEPLLRTIRSDLRE